MAVVQERREVTGFDEIRLEGTGIITLEQGQQDALVIETEDRLLPKLKSEVSGGRLILGFQHWYDHLLEVGHPTINYHITMRDVHGVSISGSGKLQAGRIETDRLRLKVSGAGDMTITDLHANDLETRFSGSGKANLTGAVKAQEVQISGSGDLRAEELSCQDARVQISGTGSVRLCASDHLQVQISGSGDVRYQGQPQIQQHISGSGSIRAI